MKYTIFGFSQQLMVEQGLNLSDAAVLRFIVDFYHTGKMKKMIIGGREYIWVSYKYVSESLPIIHIGFKSNSDRAMKKRVTDCVDRLATAGAIEKMIQKDAQGTFVFVRIIEEMYNHYIAGVTTGKVTGYVGEGNGVTTGKVTKDTSINYSSNKIEKPLSDKSNEVQVPLKKPAPIKQVEIPGETYRTSKGKFLTGKRLKTFNLFWGAFSFKNGKRAAAESWRLIPELNGTIVNKIISAAKIEASKRPGLIASGGKPKYAQGWITESRWEDERYSSTTNSSGTTETIEEENARLAQEII